MFIGEMLIKLAWALDYVINIYVWIVIASAIMSWVNFGQNPIVSFIRKITEPVFNFVRGLLPFTVIRGVDFSPIVVVLGIEFFVRPVLLRAVLLIARIFTG